MNVVGIRKMTVTLIAMGLVVLAAAILPADKVDIVTNGLVYLTIIYVGGNAASKIAHVMGKTNGS